MFNFLGFLFSPLKEIYNTCAILTQVNKKASVACFFFAGVFEIFSTSIQRNFSDDQLANIVENYLKNRIHMILHQKQIRNLQHHQNYKIKIIILLNFSPTKL